MLLLHELPNSFEVHVFACKTLSANTIHDSRIRARAVVRL